MPAHRPEIGPSRKGPWRAWPGTRFGVVGLLLAAGLASGVALDLTPSNLIPGDGGLSESGRFFARAFTPALDYEDPSVPDTAVPLLAKALQAAWKTVIFAVAASSLAMVIGMVLGVASATAWWRAGTGRWSTKLRGLGRSMPVFYGLARLSIALLRSVHELIWAVLFLAAMGLSELSAVIAIAIPYGGTLAKVFSELIDEAPRDAAWALRGMGARRFSVFVVGLLPRALPDVLAYALYRFECALRASAVLGFFGYPTLGFFIAASFENLYYGEVWTYLYALLLLIVAVDRWSAAVRRRLVA